MKFCNILCCQTINDVKHEDYQHHKLSGPEYGEKPPRCQETLITPGYEVTLDFIGLQKIELHAETYIIGGLLFMHSDTVNKLSELIISQSL